MSPTLKFSNDKYPKYPDPEEDEEGEEERLIPFCLKLPHDKAVAVNQAIRQIFDVFQTQVDFDVFENPVMCKDCSEAIAKFYAFKSLCMDTQNSISLSNFRTKKNNIDLRSIYQAETDLTLDGDTDICRLCMKPYREEGLMPIEALNMDAAFVEKWTNYMNVNLSIIENPQVCFDCEDTIQSYFKFIMNIESVERKINAYRESVGRKNEPILYSDALKYLCVNAIGCPDGITPSCIIKKEEESYFGNNFMVYSEGNLQNYGIKQEPRDIGDDIPKLETELEIKEERNDHDELFHENFDITATQGKNLLVEKETVMVKSVKLHQCIKCNYRTNYKSNLKDHMITHIDDSEAVYYHCPHCPFQTVWKGGLNRHVRRKHTASDVYERIQRSVTTTKPKVRRSTPIDTELHRCTLCNYKAKRKYSVTNHIMLCHADKSELPMFKCFHCDFETFWKQHMKRHVIKHMNPDEVPKYSCTVCPYFSHNVYALQQHSLIHKDPADVVIYECAVCGFKTKHKGSLKKHVKKHKKSSELHMYKCEHCSYETHLKNALTRHSVVHKNSTETQMHSCTLCAFVTKRSDSLKNHILTHNRGRKVHACSFCTFTTEDRKSFELHVLSHKGITEAEVYKCSVCDYETMIRRYFCDHQRIHKAESEWYRCFQCGFQTSQKRYLIRHIRGTHRSQAEVPTYSCTYCSYTCKKKFRLSRHVEVHKMGANVYECEACQFKTIHMHVLFKHKQSHLGE